MWYQQLVSLDLETSGIDLEQDRIISAAISIVGDKYPVKHYDWILNPGIQITAEATGIHGYSTEDIELQGSDPEKTLEKIITLLAEKCSDVVPLVIFNARFDLTILDREAKRYKLVPLTDRCPNLTVIDPMVIDKAAQPYRRGKRTLGALCQVYQVPFEEVHKANDDALAAARLAWRMGTKFKMGQLTASEVHQKQIEWAKKQAQGLQEYFEKQGKDENVAIEWPLIPEKQTNKSKTQSLRA
jgi:DNA polymerase-3 subunit epsilon